MAPIGGGPGGGVGGGGAGNPVGGSFTGPAQALELVGPDFCYAYSGLAEVTNSDTTLLEFTTGNYTAVVSWFPIFFVSTTDNYAWTVSLNGAEVQRNESDSATDSNETVPMQLVIPAYSEFKMICANQESGTGRNMGTTLTGRIYRTRD